MRQAEIKKRNILIDYAQRFGTKLFIETGTYKGDTVKAMLASRLFDQIHTIDIYEDRVQNAKRRFASFENVFCWHGDSGAMMRTMIGGMHGPVLFWLDAHHSGKQIARKKGLIETPIIKELQAVLDYADAERSVVLIDDARYYETFAEKYPSYPSTDEVRTMILGRFPKWTFEIDDDIIRCHCAESP